MAFLTPASEVTLVAQPGTDILTYTLTNDNPTNTSLVDLSSGLRPAYTVQTEISSSKTITIVRNSEEAIIATLQWRESLPDKVTLGDKPTISLNRWLKIGLLPLSPVSFHDDQGRKYQWKNVAAGLNMELYAMDTPGGPIAAFYRARVNASPTNNTSTPATFLMTARAREIAEIVVVSFLFLEKRRRMRENSAQSRQNHSKDLAFFRV